jgi:hypothetical protein
MLALPMYDHLPSSNQGPMLWFFKNKKKQLALLTQNTAKLYKNRITTWHFKKKTTTFLTKFGKNRRKLLPQHLPRISQFFESAKMRVLPGSANYDAKIVPSILFRAPRILL